LEEEEVYELEGQGHVGQLPAINEIDHIEQLMHVPETTSDPTTVAPYPRPNREFGSFSYATVLSEPKKLFMDLRGLQSNHVSYINKQVQIRTSKRRLP
jgi:hypothetical protein